VIFSSETISINYPTRLINKNVKFGLSEIARVKYVYGSGSGDMQELRIRVKDKGAFTITYSGSSEDVLYLLEMLEKKGIPIKIRSRILGIKNSVSKVKAK
jgi:hypothetical protein